MENEGEPDDYCEYEDENDLKLMEIPIAMEDKKETIKKGKFKRNVKNKNCKSYYQKSKSKWRNNKNGINLNEKVKKRILKQRPSCPFNSRIIESWNKETLGLFKKHGDIFSIFADGRWWVFEIDINSVDTGGIKVCESGECIKYKFGDYQIVKDCIIFVMKPSREEYHYRIRVTPSVKQDKLAIFNVDYAIKLKTEAMFAALKRYAVSEDIHWVLSLLNEKGGLGEKKGVLLYTLPKCGWYIKRRLKLNEH